MNTKNKDNSKHQHCENELLKPLCEQPEVKKQFQSQQHVQNDAQKQRFNESIKRPKPLTQRISTITSKSVKCHRNGNEQTTGNEEVEARNIVPQSSSSSRPPWFLFSKWEQFSRQMFPANSSHAHQTTECVDRRHRFVDDPDAGPPPDTVNFNRRGMKSSIFRPNKWHSKSK